MTKKQKHNLIDNKHLHINKIIHNKLNPNTFKNKGVKGGKDGKDGKGKPELITGTTVKGGLTSSNNYIKQLVNLYYNNDNVVQQFLQSANTKTHIFPEHRRIIVIGDLHGDFEATISCLVLAKCIEDIYVPKNKSVVAMNRFFKKIKWIGADTYIVQLGDQIDRIRPQDWDKNDVARDNAYKDEGSTLEIFYLFYLLDQLARDTGGRVFSIIGNHEIMNVEGDFRYVSLQEFRCFKQHLETVYSRNSKFPYHSRTLKKNSRKLDMQSNSHYSKLPDGYRERLYAFSPTGLCANMIGANSYTILQIGKWLFCHGSPVLKTVKNYSADMINSIVSMYLLGIDTNNNEIEKHYNNIANSGSDNSILWNRTFGENEDEEEADEGGEGSEGGYESDGGAAKSSEDSCILLTSQLNMILKEYNKKNAFIYDDKTDSNYIRASHIAVGHTPQGPKQNGINSICNGRVWRCDVGMSRAFGDNKDELHRRPQVLEIITEIGNGGQVKTMTTVLS